MTSASNRSLAPDFSRPAPLADLHDRSRQLMVKWSGRFQRAGPGSLRTRRVPISGVVGLDLGRASAGDVRTVQVLTNGGTVPIDVLGITRRVFRCRAGARYGRARPTPARPCQL